MPSDLQHFICNLLSARGCDHSAASECHDEVVLMMMKKAVDDGPLEVMLKKRCNGACCYRKNHFSCNHSSFLIITILNILMNNGYVTN